MGNRVTSRLLPLKIMEFPRLSNMRLSHQDYMLQNGLLHGRRYAEAHFAAYNAHGRTGPQCHGQPTHHLAWWLSWLRETFLPGQLHVYPCSGTLWDRTAREWGGFTAVFEKKKQTDNHTSKTKSLRSLHSKPKPSLESRVPL